MHFGEHLTIDGYGGSKEKLENQEMILELLAELPQKMGMKIICQPTMVKFDGNDAKDPGGVSGFVMIAESHISLHTFPKRGFLSADVYTCQNGLDIETIKKYFQEKFELKELEVNFIHRGLKYPKEDL